MDYYYFNDKRYPIKVTTETTIITGLTFQSNGTLWENDSIKQFFNEIPNEKVNIVDIGAQSGLYTLYAKYLPKAHIYSYEPFSTTFKLLNDNILLNNISNVTTINKAISDKIGTAILSVCDDHNGLHTLESYPLRFNNKTSLSVECTTLDAEFYDKEIPIHYIKIDTEGWEYYILLGGIKTIKKYKPVIQLEWNLTNMEQCNVIPEEMANLLKKLGYIESSMADGEKLFIPWPQYTLETLI